MNIHVYFNSKQFPEAKYILQNCNVIEVRGEITIIESEGRCYECKHSIAFPNFYWAVKRLS